MNGYTTNYRVAVGLLAGQGCERSELPCLADGITKQGRRSWSFYIYHIYCPVDRRVFGQMLLANDIVFGHWFPKNRWFKRKQTKTYGLERLHASLRQDRSFPLPTLPYQKTNRYAVVDITIFSYPELAYCLHVLSCTFVKLSLGVFLLNVPYKASCTIAMS